MHIAGRTHDTPLYDREDLAPGTNIDGPAIIIEPTGTNVIEPGWRATIDTLGNLVTDPRAGLCFLGPQNGDLLQFTGRMQIAWQPPDDAPAGAERMWRFIVERWSLRSGALSLRFEDGALSPYLPKD